MGSGWYLGPVGGCRQIPAPLRGVTVGRELVGKVTTSLGGTRTLWRAAQLRSWPLAWPTLTENEVTYLELVGLGLVGSPLRLLDPMCRNLLPVPVASGGSYRRDSSRFTATGGSTTGWVAVPDPPPGVPVTGAQSWVRVNTGPASLTLANPADRVPLVERPVRFSAWARGTAITVAAELAAYTAAGVATTVTGPPLLLDPVEWRYLDVVSLPAEQISAQPALSAADGQAPSTVQTTGWQVAFADQPDKWALGGAAAEVIPVDPSDTYERWSRHRYALLLHERRM